jgi:group II intron reverse transcriptase/maturase
MRKADLVLDVIRDRSIRGLHLDEDVYRQLFNQNLYLRAYSRIYKNAGAMTPGTTAETVDGMSVAKIENIIQQLRYERFQWTPVRRVQIPKKNGKMRPLGLPTWSDKLVQEVIRSLLEAFYEPRFSVHSHGFRPNRGCHTALAELSHTWKGTKWFIEGDIRGCYDNINHEVLMSIIREDIQDNRFLRLLENLLKAGYCEEWSYKPTLTGCPQGGIVSPILSNIYLDRLDKFVENILIPEYTRGEERQESAEYLKLVKRASYLRSIGRNKEAAELSKQYHQMPSRDPYDPEYRRLHYLRYADDFLLGFAGPVAEAREIKERIKTFLKEELKLELAEDKTLITHAATQCAKFLGYEVTVAQEDTKRTNGQRSVNGVIQLRVPAKFVEERCKLYMRQGKPIHRAEILQDTDFSIIATYQSEYRGYVQFYKLAVNIAKLNKLRWIMESSLLKTLANKYKASVNQMAAKYSKVVKFPHGWRKCLEVMVERAGKQPLIARFGGIPLKRELRTTINDQPLLRKPPGRSELLKRLLADECEICGTTGNIEVHHVRALKDLKTKGRKEKPRWMQIMASRMRKTLMVCRKCHEEIQYGRPRILQIGID